MRIKRNIQIGNNLNFEITNKSMMKFALPSILLMMFSSLYVMIDGVFVANYVGTIGLSGLNIVWPLIFGISSLAVMFGTGGGAICAFQLGQKKYRLASVNFSTIFAFAVLFSIAIIIPIIYCIDKVVLLLGANSEIFDYSKDYLFISLLFLPPFIIQLLTQFFLFTAGKPVNAFKLTLIGGIANIIFDYILIVVFDMGVVGAALATGIGQILAALYGVGCFIFIKNLPIRFVMPKFLPHLIAKSSLNGSSEMVSSLAGSLIVFLYNKNMMEFVGVNGVAAITIILYIEFLLISIYIGFSNGVAPLFSFNFGENNINKLKLLFSKSVYFVGIVSVFSFILTITCAEYLVMIFERNKNEVFYLTKKGLMFFSVSFAFIGFNMFASALFTAFSNGKISGILSFLRSFVFISGFLIILPKIWGLDGVWFALPIAEVLTFIIAIALLKKYRPIYKY